MQQASPLPLAEAPRFPARDLPPAAPVPPAPQPALAPVSRASSVSISETLRSRASARVELDPSASIHALLDRLERGVGRRDILPPPPPARAENLEDTLVALRRLAMTATAAR